MTRRRLTLVSAVPRSYRVGRVASLLDRPNVERVETVLTFDAPPTLDEPWRVGLIVGPSGSGKTSVARESFPNALHAPFAWDDSHALVDNFAPRPFDELADALHAVGFGSEKRWLQPYGTLSGGERFRCDLAKALLDSQGKLVVFDEYASLVDRTVARTSSIALRKAFDRGAFDGKRFVAVSCRYDVAQYLEPDWILDMDSGKLTRGRLRRAPIRFHVRAAKRRLWRNFKDSHYLSGSLNPTSRCYVATLADDLSDRAARNETPVAFAAIVQTEGRRGKKRVHRLVVRPEYQGVGLGGAFLDALGALIRNDGYDLQLVTGSRAFMRRLERSPRWRVVNVYPHGKTQRHSGKETRGSFGRAVASFEFVG